LGVWGDYEETYNGPYKGWQNFKKFLDPLKARVPLVGVYTSPDYWKNNKPSNPADMAYFGTYPLWIANYDVVEPKVPSPWLSYVFWQFTPSGDGYEFGAESKEIDLNYFHGQYVEFCEYFKLAPVQEDETDMSSEDIRYLADRIYQGLHEITEKLTGNPGGNGGTDPTTPPAGAKESIYQVVERDPNPNGMVVVYKTPDINETNTDRFSIPPAQVVRAINDWKDVPAGLVGWSQMDNIQKQNAWREWVCLHEDQIKAGSGKWRAFPDIFLQSGTVRAEYCWMLRSCLGAKVG
jgi:hypothetical protein